MFLVTLFLLTPNVKQSRCPFDRYSKETVANIWILFGNEKELNCKCKQQCDKSNKLFSTERNQRQKAIICSVISFKWLYAKDKTWGTKTICTVAREEKVTDSREAPRNFLWSQECSGSSYAHLYTANTVLFCIVIVLGTHRVHLSKLNQVRNSMGFILSIALPGSW